MKTMTIPGTQNLTVLIVLFITGHTQASLLKFLGKFEADFQDFVDVKIQNNGRYRRSPGNRSPYPQNVDVRFTALNDDVSLQLTRNDYVDQNVPIYISRAGGVSREHIPVLQNMAFYQNPEKGAAFMVEFNDTHIHSIFGTLHLHNEEYFLEQTKESRPLKEPTNQTSPLDQQSKRYKMFKTKQRDLKYDFILEGEIMNRHYTPAVIGDLQVNGENLQPADLIALYYHAGYSIKEIMGFMALRHHTVMSERQVHRILRNLNLYRRANQAPLENVIEAIFRELMGTGQNIGYRGMHRRLLTDHNIVVSMEVVRIALSVLDAEGILLRRRHNIRRRVYTNKGPNFAVHLDGWDKLKPYGISIHSCIDGFSRRILWLKACESNKKPQYIANFYLQYLKEIQGVPVLVYGDRGTENSLTRDFQYALRWNHVDHYQGLSSFQYGSSTRNTRIERFWRNLRSMCGQAYMDIFKTLADGGILDTSDHVHIECLRYCFMQLINTELHRVSRHWNEHRIRPSRCTQGPFGKPDVMYFQPEIFDCRDQKMPITEPTQLNALEDEFCLTPPVNGVSEEFEELGRLIIQQHALHHPPDTIEQALDLYCRMVAFIEQIP